MRFRDCFTADLYAISPEKYSLCQLTVRLVHNYGYRVVVYYRIAIFLKKVRFPRRLTNLLGSLILVRLGRVPGVEFRTKFEIGPGLLVWLVKDNRNSMIMR